MYAGAAAYGVSIRHNKKFHRLAGFNGASTDRAEFLGLLHGLHGIFETMCWDNSSRLKALVHRRAEIVWISDRESLVRSVTGEYRRRTQPDLWAQFEWYEQYIDIRPCHVKRNSVPWQDVADILASESRVLIKEYDQLVQDSELFKV